MAKPRFTVDPPPVGGSREDLLDWEKRQLDRIHDWWPKDLEDRLKALEIAFPYKSGTWPIVDSSRVGFFAQSVGGPCVPTAATYQTEQNLQASPLTAVDFNSLAFDGGLTRLYAAQSSSTGNGQGVTQFALSSAGDVSTISYVAFSDLNYQTTPPSELLTGLPRNLNLESQSGQKFIVTQGSYDGGRWLRGYTMSTPWDITTASRTSSYDHSGDAIFSAFDLLSMVVSRDGLHIYGTANYTSGSQWRRIYQWDLATPWDVSTASYQGESNATDVPGDNTSHIIRLYYIDDTGENILTSSGYQNNMLIRHELSVPYDITTRSYAGTLFLNNLGQVPTGGSLFIPQGCGSLYVLDKAGGDDDLQEYSIA